MLQVNKKRLNDVLVKLQTHKYLSENDELYYEDFNEEKFIKELVKSVEEILDSEEKKGDGVDYILKEWDDTFGFLRSKKFETVEEAWNNISEDNAEVFRTLK